MDINRREALSGLMAAGAIAVLNPQSGLSQTPGNPKRYPLGLQFFTLSGREKVLNWEEYSGLMKVARDIGYDSLEIAATFGHDPKKIRDYATSIGLTIPSFHMGFNQMLAFMENPQNVPRAQEGAYTPLGLEQIARINVPIALELGCQWGVIAASGKSNFLSVDAIKRLCESFNKCAETGKNAGLKVAYHMHAVDFEAVEGQMPFQIMLDNTSPDMYYQLDVCWAAAGGATPQDLIRKYPTRIVSFHLKDLTKDQKIATPGDHGIVDFAAIHDAVALVKDPIFFVERDQLNGKDAVVEATRAYKYLQPLGWGKA